MLACHLLGLPVPQLKLLPCLNTSSLGFVGLSCSEQSELGLGNKTKYKLMFKLMNLALFCVWEDASVYAR